MPNQITLLNPLLNIFLIEFGKGAVRLAPEALWLLTLFFSIELVLSGIWFVLRHDLHWPELVQKSLLAAILLWAIQQWPDLTATLARGFASAGTKAGGDTIPLADIFSPDNLITLGFSTTAVLFQNLSNASLLSPKGLGMAVVDGWVAILIVLCYFLAALGVFATLIEYYLAMSFTVILLPWAMWQKTAFLVERAVAHMFASGVRIGILAFVLSSSLPALLRVKLNTATQDDSLTQAILLLLVALTLVFLVWVSWRIASGLVYGSPSLSIVEMTRSALVTQRRQ